MRRRVKILSEPVLRGVTGKMGNVFEHHYHDSTAVFVLDAKNFLKAGSISGIIGIKGMIAVIYRPDYINTVTPFIDKSLVKILAGILRCGKSTIFEMLKQLHHQISEKRTQNGVCGVHLQLSVLAGTGVYHHIRASGMTFRAKAF